MISLYNGRAFTTKLTLWHIFSATRQIPKRKGDGATKLHTHSPCFWSHSAKKFLSWEWRGVRESRNVMQWMFLHKDRNLWRGHIGPLSLVKFPIPYSLLCPLHMQRQRFVYPNAEKKAHKNLVNNQKTFWDIFKKGDFCIEEHLYDFQQEESFLNNFFI